MLVEVVEAPKVLVADDEPTRRLLVGRTVVVLGGGGSARRLTWVSAPIESRFKLFTPGVRLILPPFTRSNELSKNACTTLPPTPLKLFSVLVAINWLFSMLSSGACPPPPLTVPTILEYAFVPP